MLRPYVSVGVWGFGYLLRLWLRETAAPKNFPPPCGGLSILQKMASKLPRKNKPYPGVPYTFYHPPSFFALSALFLLRQAFCEAKNGALSCCLTYKLWHVARFGERSLDTSILRAHHCYTRELM